MHIIAKLIEPRTQIDESKKRFDNRALLALIVPIIIEQFLVLLVGIADSLMVSYAGEEAVSGALPTFSSGQPHCATPGLPSRR